MIIGTVQQQLLLLTGDGEDDMIQAWVNFNGTGTVAIRESNNVTSITDNGVGKYQINMTTAQADVNYAVFTNCEQSDGSGFYRGMGSNESDNAPTTSSFHIIAKREGTTAEEDREFIHVSVVR